MDDLDNTDLHSSKREESIKSTNQPKLYDHPFDFGYEVIRMTGELKKELDLYDNKLIDSITPP